ncbi:glycine/betaine ABC transporter substrate-binding protein, partial [Streptomyces sp. NPDC059082]
MPSSRRGAVLAASATALLLALSTTACGTGGDSGGDKGGTVRVRIAYPAIPNADLVVKNQKLLEKALPDAHVSRVELDTGGEGNT